MNEHLLTDRVMNLPRTFADKYDGGSKDLNEELTGEGFIGLVKALNTYDPGRLSPKGYTPASFETYAYTVVQHRVESATRTYATTKQARARRSTLSLLPFGRHLWEKDGNHEGRVDNRLDLDMILSTLPPEMERTLRLRLEGKTFREIGKIQGLTFEGVRRRIVAARNELRQTFPDSVQRSSPCPEGLKSTSTRTVSPRTRVVVSSE